MKERADQMNNLQTQIGPIYVIYKSQKKIESLLESIIKKIPNYDFESFDGSSHKLWCVDDISYHLELIEAFKSIDFFYIADGHHRIGAMEYLSKLDNLNIDKFMISAFPNTQSKIFDYNRVIRDLNGYSEEKFIKLLSENFDVNLVNNPFKPEKNKF